MATWTQTDVDNLKAALAQGILTVSYAGPPARQITYQNMGQMESLLARMVAYVAKTNGASTYRLIGTSKGFDS